jgi:hypothetical protein
MSTTATTEEIVMGQVIPRQHPAVVLKSHYEAVRALLAVALIAIVALAATVVILANDDDQVSNTSSARPVESINYGGFNPATGMPVQQETLPSGTRFDGGPDEGTRGPQAYSQSASPLSTYQAPADDSADHAAGPRMIPMGPGGR